MSKAAVLWRRVLVRLVAAGCLAVLGALGGVWAYAGIYGIHVLLRHGGTRWVGVGTDSVWMSPSMWLALGSAPAAMPGNVQWLPISDGFEVADLSAMVDRHEVDHVHLARINPAKFRFEVRTAYKGDTGLDQWMAQLHPALVMTGSYSGRDGRAATPVLSRSAALGPETYDAKAGAFVSSSAFTGVRDLSRMSWDAAFKGAENAMVSFPLLVTGGYSVVTQHSRWLANRSFVGQDGEGRIITGTTTDAFFPLDRFARFLLDAPIGLTLALNLDGEPVASQAISLNGFERRTYGRWEAKVEGDRAPLLMWPYGSVAMPVVLAVFPK